MSFFLIQVNPEPDRNRASSMCVQDANSPRLDLTPNGVGRVNHQLPPVAPDPTAVIRNQVCAKRHQLQSEA